MRLIAQYPILFESKQYKVGDELPASNQEMVNAWLEAGTAKRKEDTEEKQPAKAKEVSAQAGLTGNAVGGDADDGENLVGRAAKTAARNKKGTK